MLVSKEAARYIPRHIPHIYRLTHRPIGLPTDLPTCIQAHTHINYINYIYYSYIYIYLLNFVDTLLLVTTGFAGHCWLETGETTISRRGNQTVSGHHAMLSLHLSFAEGMEETLGNCMACSCHKKAGTRVCCAELHGICARPQVVCGLILSWFLNHLTLVA